MMKTKRSGLPNSRVRRKRAKAMESVEEAMPLPHLPEHLVVVILSKLPIKSLLRLKCVSKQWCSLISDPHFIKSHLNQSRTKFIFIATSCSPYGLYTASFGSSAGSNEDIAVSKIEFLFRNKNPHCYIIGVCNGLIAIEVIYPVPDNVRVKIDFRFTFVFNPSTRESRQIPHCLDPNGKLIGFGYDECSDDYKLVNSRLDVIYVYSLRIGSWRIAHEFPNIDCCDITNATQLNGSLHWLCVKGSGSKMTLEIAALSLADDEKLWMVPLPFTNFQQTTCRLGLFGGCLCVVPGCDNPLWVMKEYGVEQSWTKLDMNITFPPILEPLGTVTDYEDLLVMDENKLVLYNKRAGTKKDLVVQHVKRTFGATVYADSLISPFMNEQQKKKKKKILNGREDR